LSADFPYFMILVELPFYFIFLTGWLSTLYRILPNKKILRDFYNILQFSNENYIEDLFKIINRGKNKYKNLIEFQKQHWF